MSAVGVAERGLEEAAGAVNGAGGYADLFGEGDGDVWLARARAQYRKLALVLHPDRAGAAGDEPFAKLGELWEEARGGSGGPVRTRDTTGAVGV
jgi:hypothetical protein